MQSIATLASVTAIVAILGMLLWSGCSITPDKSFALAAPVLVPAIATAGAIWVTRWSLAAERTKSSMSQSMPTKVSIGSLVFMWLAAPAFGSDPWAEEFGFVLLAIILALLAYPLLVVQIVLPGVTLQSASRGWWPFPLWLAALLYILSMMLENGRNLRESGLC